MILLDFSEVTPPDELSDPISVESTLELSPFLPISSLLLLSPFFPLL